MAKAEEYRHVRMVSQATPPVHSGRKFKDRFAIISHTNDAYIPVKRGSHQGFIRYSAVNHQDQVVYYHQHDTLSGAPLSTVRTCFIFLGLASSSCSGVKVGGRKALQSLHSALQIWARQCEITCKQND